MFERVTSFSHHVHHNQTSDPSVRNADPRFLEQLLRVPSVFWTAYLRLETGTFLQNGEFRLTLGHAQRRTDRQTLRRKWSPLDEADFYTTTRRGWTSWIRCPLCLNQGTRLRKRRGKVETNDNVLKRLTKVGACGLQCRP